MENRVLITGANGQVGQSLLEILRRNQEIKAIPADRKKLDIGNPDQAVAFFQEHELDGCINCAAYTAVDQAESEPKQAQLINSLGPGLLASLCKDQSIPFIHLSTDYVYHDTSITPLTEEAEVNPQSVYARTKYEGDLATLEAGGTVVRTSWVYAPWGKNFLRTMLG
ncbi:MAG: sugar nucleotide-binding protein, partial [Bacteroidota bacterium]